MQDLQSLDTIETITHFENRPLRRMVYRNRSDPFLLDDEDFRKRYALLLLYGDIVASSLVIKFRYKNISLIYCYL